MFNNALNSSTSTSSATTSASAATSFVAPAFSQLSLTQAMANPNVFPLSTTIVTGLGQDHIGVVLPNQLVEWYKGDVERTSGVMIEHQPEPSLLAVQNAYVDATREYISIQIKKHPDIGSFKMWLTALKERINSSWEQIMRQHETNVKDAESYPVRIPAIHAKTILLLIAQDPLMCITLSANIVKKVFSDQAPPPAASAQSSAMTPVELALTQKTIHPPNNELIRCKHQTKEVRARQTIMQHILKFPEFIANQTGLSKVTTRSTKDPKAADADFSLFEFEDLLELPAFAVQRAQYRKVKQEISDSITLETADLYEKYVQDVADQDAAKIKQQRMTSAQHISSHGDTLASQYVDLFSTLSKTIKGLLSACPTLTQQVDCHFDDPLMGTFETSAYKSDLAGIGLILTVKYARPHLALLFQAIEAAHTPASIDECTRPTYSASFQHVARFKKELLDQDLHKLLTIDFLLCRGMILFYPISVKHRNEIANRFFELIDVLKNYSDHHGNVRWENIPLEYHLYPPTGPPELAMTLSNAMFKWCQDKDSNTLVNEVHMGYMETPPLTQDPAFDAHEFARTNKFARGPNGELLGRPQDLKNPPTDTSRVQQLRTEYEVNLVKTVYNAPKKKDSKSTPKMTNFDWSKGTVLTDFNLTTTVPYDALRYVILPTPDKNGKPRYRSYAAETKPCTRCSKETGQHPISHYSMQCNICGYWGHLAAWCHQQPKSTTA